MSKWRLRLHHQVTGGALQAALLIDAAAAGMCGEAGDGVVCVGVDGAMATFAVAVAAVDAPIAAAAAVAAGCDDAVHRVAAVL